MTHYKLCNSCGELFKVKDARRDFLCSECEQLPIAIEGTGKEMECVREIEAERENKISKEQYEKDVRDVTVKLGTAVQQVGICYPDIAFDCVEKTRVILLKYKGLSEEEREKLK